MKIPAVCLLLVVAFLPHGYAQTAAATRVTKSRPGGASAQKILARAAAAKKTAAKTRMTFLPQGPAQQRITSRQLVSGSANPLPQLSLSNNILNRFPDSDLFENLYKARALSNLGNINFGQSAVSTLTGRNAAKYRTNIPFTSAAVNHNLWNINGNGLLRGHVLNDYMDMDNYLNLDYLVPNSPSAFNGLALNYYDKLFDNDYFLNGYNFGPVTAATNNFAYLKAAHDLYDNVHDTYNDAFDSDYLKYYLAGTPASTNGLIRAHMQAKAFENLHDSFDNDNLFYVGGSPAARNGLLRAHMQAKVFDNFKDTFDSDNFLLAGVNPNFASTVGVTNSGFRLSDDGFNFATGSTANLVDMVNTAGMTKMFDDDLKFAGVAGVTTNPVDFRRAATAAVFRDDDVNLINPGAVAANLAGVNFNGMLNGNGALTTTMRGASSVNFNDDLFSDNMNIALASSMPGVQTTRSVFGDDNNFIVLSGKNKVKTQATAQKHKNIEPEIVRSLKQKSTSY